MTLEVLAEKVDRLEKLVPELVEKMDTIGKIVTRIDERDRATDKQLDAIFKRLDHVLTNSAEKAELAALKVRVDALEKKPGQRWDIVVSALIGSGVGGIVASIIAGLKP